MANINLKGILRDPNGEFSYKNKIRFTHNTNTGQTLKGFRSIHDIAVNGAYDINVEYGNVAVDTFDFLNQQWVHHGVFTINSDTPANSIPSLLGITTPSTDSDLLVFQALVADASESASEAEAALASTQALFTGFDGSVSASLSINSPSNIDWDLSLPLQSSKPIDKIVGSMTFTRASTAYYFDKSGYLQSVANNIPAYDSHGLQIFDSITNLLTYSEFNSNGTQYPISSSSKWSGFSAVNNIGMMGLASATAEVKDTTLSVAGNSFHASCVVSAKGTGSFTRFRVESNGTSPKIIDLNFNWSGGSLSSVTESLKQTGWSYIYDKLGKGLYRVQCRYDATVESLSNAYVRIAIYSESASLTSYYGAFQLVEGFRSLDIPYVRTTTASATRAAEALLIPLAGNFYPYSQSFSLLTDVTVSNKSNGFSEFTKFQVNEASAVFLMRYYHSLGETQFYYDKSDGTDSLVTKSESVASRSKMRVISVFDGLKQKISVNGEVSESTVSTSDRCTPNFSGSIVVTGTNGRIKNFRILPYALTNDQIKALGSAK